MLTVCNRFCCHDLTLVISYRVWEGQAGGSYRTLLNSCSLCSPFFLLTAQRTYKASGFALEWGGVVTGCGPKFKGTPQDLLSCAGVKLRGAAGACTPSGVPRNFRYRQSYSVPDSCHCGVSTPALAQADLAGQVVLALHSTFPSPDCFGLRIIADHPPSLTHRHLQLIDRHIVGIPLRSTAESSQHPTVRARLLSRAWA